VVPESPLLPLATSGPPDLQKLSLKKNKSQGRSLVTEEASSSAFELPPSLPEALQVASKVGASYFYSSPKTVRQMALLWLLDSGTREETYY
jgi:hypothetical protein